MLSCAQTPRACMWNDEEEGLQKAPRTLTRMEAMESKIMQMQAASMAKEEVYDRQFAELRNLYEELAGVHKRHDREKTVPLLPLSSPHTLHENSVNAALVMDKLERLQKRVLDLEQTVDILETSGAKDNPAQRLLDLEQRFQAFETHLNDLPEEDVLRKQDPQKNRGHSVRKSVSLDARQTLEGFAEPGDEPLEREASEVDALIGADFSEVQVTLVDFDIDVETRSREYRDILAAAECEYPLESDVWGASTFVIIKDFPDVFWGEITQENVMRIAFVVLLLVLNVFFQIAMVYYIAVYVMLPNVASVQQTYAMYHEVAFTNGKFDQASFKSLGDRRLVVCGMGISTQGFLWTCVFLWVARCINEMRVCYVQYQKLAMLPTLPHGIATIHMVHEVTVRFGDCDFLKEEKNMVVCKNRSTYCCLLFVVFLPRFLVSVCLLVMGTAFLTSAPSFSDLVLNTLALAFIFQIDQLFYETFLPHRIKQNLQHTKFMTPREDDHTNLSTKELDAIDVHRVYRRSGVILAMVLLATFLWFYVQPVIPGFESDVHPNCLDFLEKASRVPCKWWQKDCFPK